MLLSGSVNYLVSPAPAKIYMLFGAPPQQLGVCQPFLRGAPGFRFHFGTPIGFASLALYPPNIEAAQVEGAALERQWLGPTIGLT